MSWFLTVEKADVIDNWQMTNDNLGIGFADDFKYNYTEGSLFKGFIKISAEGGTITVICHFSIVILLLKLYLGFIAKLKPTRNELFFC